MENNRLETIKRIAQDKVNDFLKDNELDENNVYNDLTEEEISLLTDSENYDEDGNWISDFDKPENIKREHLLKWENVDFTNLVNDVIELAKEYREIMGYDMDDQSHPLTGMTCMSCFSGEYHKMKSINLKCDNCGVIQRGYIPLPAYAPFHKDRTTIKVAFGGFGAGKTTACINEDIEFILQVPKTKLLIGASDLKQLSGVAMLEFFAWLPENTIAKPNKKDNEFILKNGSHVFFRPLYDEEKLKSLNLNRAHIIESSAIRINQQRPILDQLSKRIRNQYYISIKDDHSKLMRKGMQELSKTTTVLLKKGFYKIDARQIVIESNTVDHYYLDLAIQAKTIHHPENQYHKYENIRPPKEKRKKIISTWVFPSYVNKFLAPAWLEEQKSLLSEDEYAVKIEGSLLTKKGGSGFKNIKYVDPFPIPKHWKRVFATDSGINDLRSWGAAAIKPSTGDVYVYGLIGKSQWTIKDHAQYLKKHLSTLPFGIMFKPIQADKQLFNTRDKDKGDGFTSSASTYERLGIILTKATTQANASTIEQGISHFNNMSKQGMIHILNSYDNESLNDGMVVTPDAINHIRKYIRKEDGTLPQVRNVDIPDTLRYLIGVIPSNREDLLKIQNNSFYQNPTTFRIEDKGKSVFAQKLFNDPIRENETNEIDEDFEKYSPFKI